MSYFGTIYADTELPSRARAVYMYLRDRADSEGNAGQESRRLRPTCACPAPRSNEL